jgi:hypothetical protein
MVAGRARPPLFVKPYKGENIVRHYAYATWIGGEKQSSSECVHVRELAVCDTPQGVGQVEAGSAGRSHEGQNRHLGLLDKSIVPPTGSKEANVNKGARQVQKKYDNLPQTVVAGFRSTNCWGTGPSPRNLHRYCHDMGQHGSRLVAVHSARARYCEYLLGGEPG